MTERPSLDSADRIAVWDAALAAVRTVLRAQGLREVVTPVRVDAVAVEPFIEPVAAGRGFLATSPELPMKRLLARGSGSIFQIAPCFRAAEHGDHHREEFHLIEWYRVGEPPSLPEVQRDVERLVAAVYEAVAAVVPERPDRPVARPGPPRRWEQVELLPLLGQTLAVDLRGDEGAPALRATFDRRDDVRTRLGDPLATLAHDRLAPNPRAHALAAWTAVFSAWADAVLDPWVQQRADEGVGVHVHGFPPALAALSEVDAGVAHRFESYVHGCELANGYRELRDATEQRRRFEDVNTLRASLDLAPLPLCERFLGALADPGLPSCAGAALGLDRLVMLAAGCSRLGDVLLESTPPYAL